MELSSEISKGMQLEALWYRRIHSPCYRISFVVNGGGRDEGRRNAYKGDFAAEAEVVN